MNKTYRIMIADKTTGEQIQTYCDTYKKYAWLKKWLNKYLPSNYKLIYCYPEQTVTVDWNIFKLRFESIKTK